MHMKVSFTFKFKFKICSDVVSVIDGTKYKIQFIISKNNGLDE